MGKPDECTKNSFSDNGASYFVYFTSSSNTFSDIIPACCLSSYWMPFEEYILCSSRASCRTGILFLLGLKLSINAISNFETFYLYFTNLLLFLHFPIQDELIKL
jgi:hypothetical protein